MRKIKVKKELSAQHLLRISDLFEKKKWLIEKTDDANNSLFNRYCQRILDVGENKKRDLVLELTEQYLWISEEKYLECLISALVKLLLTDIDIGENTKFYVLQLIAPKDVGKTKSSAMVVYLFNNVKLRHHKIISKYKFEIIDDKSRVNDILKDDNAILILADDYVGTGETAEKCILSLNLDDRLYNKIKIVCLVAQKSGIDYLNKYNIHIYSCYIRDKGITDFYSGVDLITNINIMTQIEEKMSIKKDYKFGYGNSEALVTMSRTPNNTFPIFWEEKGSMNIAPFPRF